MFVLDLVVRPLTAAAKFIETGVCLRGSAPDIPALCVIHLYSLLARTTAEAAQSQTLALFETIQTFVRPSHHEPRPSARKVTAHAPRSPVATTISAAKAGILFS